MKTLQQLLLIDCHTVSVAMQLLYPSSLPYGIALTSHM